MTSEERLTRIEVWREDYVPEQRAKNEDVEQRLRRCEKAIYGCSGALGVLMFLLKLWKP